jgi:hypothetical protein
MDQIVVEWLSGAPNRSVVITRDVERDWDASAAVCDGDCALVPVATSDLSRPHASPEAAIEALGDELERQARRLLEAADEQARRDIDAAEEPFLTPRGAYRSAQR